MVIIRIWEGLGNQMFQYAYARALKEKGIDVRLDMDKSFDRSDMVIDPVTLSSILDNNCSMRSYGCSIALFSSRCTPFEADFLCKIHPSSEECIPFYISIPGHFTLARKLLYCRSVIKSSPVTGVVK